MGAILAALASSIASYRSCRASNVMTTFKQGELLFPKEPFTAKVGNSVIRAARGQSFWVVSSTVAQERDGIVYIARSNSKGGFPFTLADANRFFAQLPEPQTRVTIQR